MNFYKITLDKNTFLCYNTIIELKKEVDTMNKEMKREYEIFCRYCLKDCDNNGDFYNRNGDFYNRINNLKYYLDYSHQYFNNSSIVEKAKTNIVKYIDKIEQEIKDFRQEREIFRQEKIEDFQINVHSNEFEHNLYYRIAYYMFNYFGIDTRNYSNKSFQIVVTYDSFSEYIKHEDEYNKMVEDCNRENKEYNESQPLYNAYIKALSYGAKENDINILQVSMSTMSFNQVMKFEANILGYQIILPWKSDAIHIYKRKTVGNRPILHYYGLNLGGNYCFNSAEEIKNSDVREKIIEKDWFKSKTTNRSEANKIVLNAFKDELVRRWKIYDETL